MDLLSDQSGIKNTILSGKWKQTKLDIDVRGVAVKVLFISIIATLIGWLSYLELYNSKVEALRADQQNVVIDSTRMLEQQLGRIEDGMRFLESSELVRTAVDDPPKRIKQLQQYFQRFGLASNFISQIRWIDNNGQEFIRTDFINGKARVYENAKLQNKANRDYVIQGLETESPYLHISSINLNREYGRPSLPFQPTIRVVSKTSKDTHAFSGVLVINYDLTAMFENLRQLTTDTVDLNILNDDGYWLLNTNPDREWGFELNLSDYTLALDKPKIWQHIQDKEHLAGDLIEGNLITAYHVDMQSDSNSQKSDLIIIARTQEQTLVALQQYILALGIAAGLSIFVLGVVVVYREVSYQKKLLQLNLVLETEKSKLAELNTRLEHSFIQQQRLQQDLVESHSLASLGSMVAGVAHELNTPLGTALTSVTYSHEELKALQENAVKGMTKQDFTRALNLVGEGLTLSQSNLERAASQVDSFKRMAMERESEAIIEFKVEQVLGDLLKGIEAGYGNDKPLVTYSVTPGLMMFSLPGKLSQVIQGLVVNAIEHGCQESQRDYVIDIEIKKVKHKEVVLRISDNGSGIAANIKDKLFKPFITDKRGKGHTGLGLFFIHQWVTQLLKGKIRLNEELPSKTVFEITLPQELSK